MTTFYFLSWTTPTFGFERMVGCWMNTGCNFFVGCKMAKTVSQPAPKNVALNDATRRSVETSKRWGQCRHETQPRQTVGVQVLFKNYSAQKNFIPFVSSSHWIRDSNPVHRYQSYIEVHSKTITDCDQRFRDCHNWLELKNSTCCF